MQRESQTRQYGIKLLFRIGRRTDLSVSQCRTAFFVHFVSAIFDDCGIFINSQGRDPICVSADFCIVDFFEYENDQVIGREDKEYE